MRFCNDVNGKLNHVHGTVVGVGVMKPSDFNRFLNENYNVLITTEKPLLDSKGTLFGVQTIYLDLYSNPVGHMYSEVVSRDRNIDLDISVNLDDVPEYYYDCGCILSGKMIKASEV